MTAGIVYYMTKERSQLRTLQDASTAEYSTFSPTAGSEGGQEAAVGIYPKKTEDEIMVTTICCHSFLYVLPNKL